MNFDIYESLYKERWVHYYFDSGKKKSSKNHIFTDSKKLLPFFIFLFTKNPFQETTQLKLNSYSWKISFIFLFLTNMYLHFLAIMEQKKNPISFLTKFYFIHFHKSTKTSWFIHIKNISESNPYRIEGLSLSRSFSSPEPEPENFCWTADIKNLIFTPDPNLVKSKMATNHSLLLIKLKTEGENLHETFLSEL